MSGGLAPKSLTYSEAADAEPQNLATELPRKSVGWPTYELTKIGAVLGDRACMCREVMHFGEIEASTSSSTRRSDG
jgi:hypothetical protein